MAVSDNFDRPTASPLREHSEASETRTTFLCTLALPRPRTFALIAGSAIVVVLVLAAGAGLVRTFGDTPTARLLMALFWLESERNLPTFVNFALLVSAAALLSLITVRALTTSAPWRWHWLALGLVFLLLAYDEAASLHETLGRYGKHIAEPTGIFRFAWVAVALPIVGLFAIGFLRFLLNLPRQTAVLVALSGVIYVGGAIGMEMVAAAFFDAAGGTRSVIYGGVTMLEEGAEMAGITIFCVALLSYLTRPTTEG